MKNKIEATVVLGNLVFGAVGEGDALDSLLFAQLAADDALNKFDSPENWFSECRRAMIKSKWMGLTNYSGGFEPGEKDRITLEDLIEQHLLSHLSRSRAREIKHMLDCTFTLAETDEPWALFRRNIYSAPDEASGNSTIALQVSVIEQQVHLFSLFVTFTTSSAVESDLWHQEFPASSIVGSVELRFIQRQWNRSSYRRVRDGIRRYLAGKKDGFVLPVSCSNSVGDDNG